ncbi:MAG: hypothetical protein JRI95_16615 [Deltaproteobacteria bacterium]|nr:hypothetical protein [Deltaproteobacteria bacterium]
MKQWRLKFFGFILLSFLLLTIHMNWSNEAFGKSENAKKGPRVLVIFVDMSGSANLARHTVYTKAFEKISQNLSQGDRVMVGTITGRSYIDFKPSVDVEIPEKTIWVNRIQFERNLTEAKEKIRREVDRLLSRKRGTQHTEILNSLNIAETFFHNEKRQKILVILSDMIQDSKEYNFDKTKVTDKYIDKAIRYRQKHDLIPNLSDVKIYVAGASGTDSNKFRSVEKFWARYFAKSGADFSHHRYGHSLIDFEK